MLIDADKLQEAAEDKQPPLPPTEEPPPYVARGAQSQPSTSTSSQDAKHARNSTTRPPPAPSDPIFLTPAANYLSIVESRTHIKGAWTINTSLAPPPFLLSYPSPSTSTILSDKQKLREIKEAEKDGTGAVMSANGTMLRPNLRAKNHSGKIDAAVRVVGGCRGSEPAVLSFANTWGIKVSVPFRGAQKIYIRATCSNGPIDILIPRDFFGLIHSRTMRGSLILSPAVTAVATTFSVQKGAARTFIGDWASVDWGEGGMEMLNAAPDVVSWAESDTSASPVGDVDTLFMEAAWGKMSVAFVDE